MHVTAKVKLGAKTAPGHAGADSTTLSFYPDYADGRNQAWATTTPSLNLTMTVKNDVATHFIEGGAYTLTFTPDEA